MDNIFKKYLIKDHIHEILKNDLNDFLELLNSKYCSKDILLITNENKENVLMAALLYQQEAVKHILNSIYCSTELFEDTRRLTLKQKFDDNNKENKENIKICRKENILMIACEKTNTELFELLLKSEYCTKEAIMNLNHIKSNLLMYVCYFGNEDMLKVLIDFNDEYIKFFMDCINDNGYNFILTIKNEDSFNYLTKHKCFTKDMLTIKTKNNSSLFLLSVGFKSDIAILIYNSEFFNIDMLLSCNKYGNNALLMICNSEHKILDDIKKSNHMNEIRNYFSSLTYLQQLYYYFNYFKYYEFCQDDK